MIMVIRVDIRSNRIKQNDLTTISNTMWNVNKAVTKNTADNKKRVHTIMGLNDDMKDSIRQGIRKANSVEGRIESLQRNMNAASNTNGLMNRRNNF